MTKKVLVTGASGYIAASLFKELAQDVNYKVYATTRDSSNSKDLQKKFPEVTLLEVNLNNSIQVSKVLKEIRPETIFHLAGKLFFNRDDSREIGLTSNVEPATTILSSIKRLKFKPRVILASTALVYERYEGQITEKDPIRTHGEKEPYKLSKIEQELAVKPYLSDPEMRLTILRFSNITGWGRQMNRVCTDFARQVVLRKKGIIAPDSKLLHFSLDKGIDILSVHDAARALVLVDKVEQGLAGEIFNVTAGESHRIGEIFEVMKKTSGVESINIPDFEKERPPFIFDNSKFKELTGWQKSQGFEDVVDEVYQYCLSLWHRSNPETRNEIFGHYINEARHKRKESL